jgi:tRNA (adenine22-N1)-methyltransferase
MVPPGAVVADIGTDHAYLPIRLVQSGQVNQAIASDVSPGSLAKARQAVVAARLEHKISLRLGSGLTVLAPGEAPTVVIAGLGPDTIAAIIQETPQVAACTQLFILQPMHNPGQLRRLLGQLGLMLIDEHLVREKQRFYVVMAVKIGTMPLFSPELMEIGPCLVAKSDPWLPAYVAQKISQEEQIRSKIGHSPGRSAQVRRQLADQRIHAWREILYGSESQLCDKLN